MVDGQAVEHGDEVGVVGGFEQAQHFVDDDVFEAGRGFWGEFELAGEASVF